jgi:hypothetical protein
VVAGDKKIEDYRNTFANLALPLFAMCEPVAPKGLKHEGLTWSLWDRWTLVGDLTVQQVCGRERSREREREGGRSHLERERGRRERGSVVVGPLDARGVPARAAGV